MGSRRAPCVAKPGWQPARFFHEWWFDSQIHASVHQNRKALSAPRRLYRI
jgi:hypothetical protein